ncbi:MAG: hypothetical protein N2039_15845 [Gemmataceae bacterium]|nr:hypothetical protein [Gemmataceae bacterium]
MRGAIPCLVLLTVSLPIAKRDEYLRRAWDAFDRGRQQRDDTAAARRSFAEAARLAAPVPGGKWIRRLEGHAALLAGDIPHAIEAYRRGLLVDPDDADLRRGLELARSRVEYTTADDRLQLTWRGPTDSGFRWFFRRWGIGAVAIASSLTALALGRWWASRYWRRLLPAAGAACLTLVLAGAWWWERQEREWETVRDFVVIRQMTMIHTGNHSAFPPRRETPLPPGVEARLRYRAADWLQIELFDGTIGWVPAEAVRVVPSK